MLVDEYKLDRATAQYARMDAAIRSAQFVRKYDPKRRKAKRLQSHNYQKAQKKLAKAYLQVPRQREDFARNTVSALVSSHDLLAHEDLQICNLVKNDHLAKAIHHAAWGRFLLWLGYYARLHRVPLIAVPPQYTTQACSGCGRLVRKTLSTRTMSAPTEASCWTGMRTRRAISWRWRCSGGSTCANCHTVPPGRRELVRANRANVWGLMASMPVLARARGAPPGRTKNLPASAG